MAEVAEEFASSLNDLMVNSKPLINMLTMLAEDNHEFADHITETVLNHLQKVPPEIKLPVLYLIDSIIKNVRKNYIPLFTQSIVQHFASTFEKVDEKTREQMFKLRQTWNEVFPAKTMLALDAKVQKIDPAWPCTITTAPSTVHLNPKFFKPDMLDPKSLATTIKDPDSQRSRNRKNKTSSQTRSSSSRSRKPTSPVADYPIVEVDNIPSSSNDALRGQMILKQKMYLELQQQKLKLELLQTQAQLEEQQIQLEKQSANHKSAAEASAKALKLQEKLNKEEMKFRIMSRNLKKHIDLNFPKRQEAHRVSREMKVQAHKVESIPIKGPPTVPEGLLKPGAVLELTQDMQESLNVKPAKPAVKHQPVSVITIPTIPKDTKSRNIQILQAIEKQKAVAHANEDVAAPVRIAPVSSELINAALSFGRNIRDPRIRQMSSRLENQLNASAQISTPTTMPPSTPNPTLKAATSIPVKKSDNHDRSHSKSRRDKKYSNSHHSRDKSTRSSEEENKYKKSPSKSNERTNKKGDKSPSKKVEEKGDRKSRVDDLFESRPKSPVLTRITSSSQSPSKSHSKREQSPKINVNERIHKEEPSPKRAKLQDNWKASHDLEASTELAVATTTKQHSNVKASQSVKKFDSTPVILSPESLDSSLDMLDEDIEKIVKSAHNTQKVVNKEKQKVEDSQKCPKLFSDSPHTNVDNIVKNPPKQMKSHEVNVPDDLSKKSTKSVPFEDVLNENSIRHNLGTNTSTKSMVPSEPVKTAENSSNAKLVNMRNTDSFEINTSTKTSIVDHHQAHTSETSANVQQKPDLTTQNINFPAKDPRLHVRVQENKPALDRDTTLSFQEESKEMEVDDLYKPSDEFKNAELEGEDLASIKMQFSDNVNDNSLREEILTTQVSEFEQNKHFQESSKPDSNQFSSVDPMKLPEIQNLKPPLSTVEVVTEQIDSKPLDDSSFSLNYHGELSQNIPSSIQNAESEYNAVQEIKENAALPSEFPSPKKMEKRVGSPIHQERKARKGEKPSIMEQIIADAEKHEASPSPPPPPIISDKFKEIKQSSLTRLRRVGRLRDDLEDSESPEPADVDLRSQNLPPSLIKDPKNEVLGLAEKDVDLRNLSASPSKKRPAMEKLLDDLPPAKKSKAEVIDELFGSEDVDLRPVLCPPPPSPPPPPIISRSPPPESGWRLYKETKPDTYKVKYTPSRRDRAPSVDNFSSRSSESSRHGRTRTSSYQKDVDMRSQQPAPTDDKYNRIAISALEQKERGEIDDDTYRRVLGEVWAKREKHQLEEAQRREEEESAQAEHIDPISDEDVSGGSLSGVEDAPSPTDSYTGEESEEVSFKIPEGKAADVDIRLPPVDIDIRMAPPSQMAIDSTIPPRYIPTSSPYDSAFTPSFPPSYTPSSSSEEKERGDPLFHRRSKDGEKSRLHSLREEARAQRREKRVRRTEKDRDLQYRNSRYADWDSQENTNSSVETKMDVEPPRVPPIPHLPPPRPGEQQDTPPLRPPGPWDMQRMAGPGPWLPGMAPPIIGPPVTGLRPVMPDRYIPGRWRPPGPMFDGQPPGPRFNRLAPPPNMGRFPVPLAPYEVPPTDPVVLKLIEQDPTKSINIDGVPRDIRFYGSKAVALMNWDDPREVSFQDGTRRIIMDDRESLVVHLNGPPQEIIIDGKPHRVRFGAPTRELYIDNQWYEVFFGGAPITCDIDGKPHKFMLEGPPPNVRPGIQRKDLVVCKVSLIVDAIYIFTIYLDAKPQKFEVDGISYIIRFVEALQKTVINGVAFKSDFGGLPRPIILNGTKHFYRLTSLPRGVTPGFLTIVNMEGGRMPSPPTLPAPPQLPASLEHAVELNKEPNVADPFLQPPMSLVTAPPRLSPELLNSADAVPPLHPPTISTPIPSVPLTTSLPAPTVNTLDMLATLMPTPDHGQAVEYSYSVDNESSNPTTTVTPSSATNSITTSGPALTGEINVTELLQKLMATGIVPKLDQTKEKDQDKPVVADSSLIRPVDFRKPETLKIRQSALVSHLYSGIQCNSCGVRFPPEQTMKYSQHLDWHFRQNRRDKDSTRTAQTRRYYYDVNDWVQFEEIEDLEERAQPWFEMQEGGGAAGTTEEAVLAELVSVRAADYPEDAACHICQDNFESFYNEEKEEWQLRNAVDTEGKLAHPLCIEDQRAAAEKPIVLDDIDITGDESKEEVETKETEEPAKVEEDDDIMEVTDIEFIKPVFPVEDLTVSDSESVADNNEEKSDILDEEMKDEVKSNKPEEESLDDATVKSNSQSEALTDQVMEEMKGEDKDEGAKENSDEVMEESSKDENTQDDLIVMDKGEDSIPSEAEIQEVVRNIKKDPDALGGEYEEVQDSDVKKEKGEVPLPSPVVDTTHATVTCLIDGNVEFEETQQLSVVGPSKIKINITKPNVQVVAKESKEVAAVAVVEVDSDRPLVFEPPPPGEELLPLNVKEKLRGKLLQELPPVMKGKEMSGLCSIM